MQKTIAIIGAGGQMGTSIAANLSRENNYQILLFDRDRKKAETVYSKIKEFNSLAPVEVVDCPFEGSWEADIIIPAVPYSAQKEIAEKIKEVVTGKIVLSIVNPFNNTFDGLVTPMEDSAAEELQRLLPYSIVIKAFNANFAEDFKRDRTQTLMDSFIAGNNEEALRTVADLVKHTGFNPVIAGPLSISRTLENMMALLISVNRIYNQDWIAGWKVLHKKIA